MIIKKHGSFYIRNGWPNKIIVATRGNNHIFSPQREMDAVDTLGVGRVMVKSMRYWSKVLGLTGDTHDQTGVVTEPTELANIIYKYDCYFQSLGTLWLLHRNLSNDLDNATAWYWAFNIYSKSRFSKQDFSDDFHSYLIAQGTTYNRNAVGQEFDCFKNTYVSDAKFDIHKIIEEDTIPFFAPLSLISYEGSAIFEKKYPLSKNIPTQIFYYSILEDNKKHLEASSQISIETLLNEQGQAGRYMNLTYTSLLELLQKTENAGYIRLYNNFGSRYIDVGERNAQGILQAYYAQIEE